MKYAVGIDIGGTNTRVALISDTYEVLERVQFATDVNEPQNTLKKIKESIKGFDKEIVGTGVSCPGPLDLINGAVLDAPNLPGWHFFKLADEMKELLGVPVFLENDANLATLAEATIGKGKEYRYVSFLTISTGVGAGLVINREIYQGAHGFAHEIANMPLWRNGPSHGIIKPGGIEAISSGTAITARAIAKGLDVKHAGEVNDLANEGNAQAKEVMEDAKEYLANGIASIINLLDPEIVILGGSVALKIDGFVEDIQRRVETKTFDNLRQYVNIQKSNLDEDSGLIGAAALAFTKVVA
ncbi:sugar kinase [Erysipelotrichaceae bacterium MTC7]|nr:sugar kinase [Erysipelotrichaceae bacterium MTC7]